MKIAHTKQRNVIIVLAAMMLVAVITAGSVFAYLKTNTEAVNNDFGVADEADPTVNETFVGNQKTDVAVTVPNEGYAVYVRAAIVITWKDKDGKVLGQPPVEGTDYVIDLNATDWFEEGGFYYCISPVNSGNNSPVLIKSVQMKSGVTAPSGYGLNVEIISQTIQALGETDSGSVPAVTDAWNVDVDTNGHLKP